MTAGRVPPSASPIPTPSSPPAIGYEQCPRRCVDHPGDSNDRHRGMRVSSPGTAFCAMPGVSRRCGGRMRRPRQRWEQRSSQSGPRQPSLHRLWNSVIGHDAVFSARPRHGRMPLPSICTIAPTVGSEWRVGRCQSEGFAKQIPCGRRGDRSPSPGADKGLWRAPRRRIA